MFIDVHCHIDFCEKEGVLSAFIERARKAQVRTIITNGVNPESNRSALALARSTKEIQVALGLYPIDALTLTDAQIEQELDFIREKRNEIVAIGEVGMDFKEDEKDHERQRDIFRKIVLLAQELQKPLIVHSRKAEEACIDILERMKAEKVIMHCFSGKWKLVERVVAHPWFLTIPTSVIASEHFQRIALEIPLTRLFCETDAPYLHPDKHWPNEPALVVRAYEKLAAIKGVPLEDVQVVLQRNYEKLFEKLYEQ